MTRRPRTTTKLATGALVVALLAIPSAAAAAPLAGSTWDGGLDRSIDLGSTWDADADLGSTWDADADLGSTWDADLIVGLAEGSTASDLDAGTVIATLDDLGMVLVAGDDATATTLAADADVTFVTRDSGLSPTADGLSHGQRDREGTLSHSAATSAGMQQAWASGATGKGSTVAVIDTGVNEHADLAGRVIHGVNLAGDGTSEDLFGHGTVMAGLIAGNGASSQGRWMGAAPDARIVSVKVASRDGATDVSQLLAAIQWVVSYRADYDIDVVLLAYGNDSVQSSTVDPLAFAIQRAYDAGILFVTSAGNSGDGRTEGTITSPGSAPAALTVGSYDLGAARVATSSGAGPTVDGVKKPELVAVGTDLVAPMAPNSYLARQNPNAIQDGAYLRGSGSSQAAAVVAGAAAAMVQVHPHDDVATLRGRLMKAATKVDAFKPARGEGLFDWSRVQASAKPKGLELRGRGNGSLHAARGNAIVHVDGEAVTGERDVFGNEWNGSTWTGSTWTGSTWTGSTWTGSTWTGSTWTGSTWTGSTWTGSTWTGSTWTSGTWQ